MKEKQTYIAPECKEICIGSWRMPTDQEWNWLIGNATKTKEIKTHTNGVLFQNANGSIYLPFDGYKKDSGIYNSGYNTNGDGSGYYWSSDLSNFDNYQYAYRLYIIIQQQYNTFTIESAFPPLVSGNLSAAR